MRRRRGKTDTVDAEAAARAALCGAAAVKPKSADGCVEAIRMLSAAPRCAVKARTAAANQIDGLAVTAPEHLKDGPAGTAHSPHRQGLRPAAARPEPRHRHRRGQDDPARPGAAPPGAHRRDSAARRRAAAPVRTGEPGAAGRPRRRRRGRLGAARRRRGQPPADAQRGVGRRAVRHQPHRGVLRAHRAPPAQPRRQPPSQQRPVAHRHAAPARRRTQHQLRRPPTPPRARPAARPCAAPSATPHARSTGCSPTRPQCPEAPTCDASAHNKGPPSTRQPAPCAPRPPKSQNSKEASATIATSPNATNDTSPQTRLDGT